jgi:hypothetical protein
VTTVAGNGLTSPSTGVDGPATAMALNGPRGLGVGFDGVYIADTGNSYIWRLDEASGNLIRFAGDGSGAPSPLEAPAFGASVGQPGSMSFVNFGSSLRFTDSQNHTVSDIALFDTTLRRAAGTGVAGFSDGAALSSLLSGPAGVSEGFIADRGNHRVRLVDGGHVLTLAGNGAVAFTGEGLHPLTEGIDPSGVVLTPSARVVIADQANHRIRAFPFQTSTQRFYLNQPLAGGYIFVDGIDSDASWLRAEFTEPDSGEVTITAYSGAVQAGTHEATLTLHMRLCGSETCDPIPDEQVRVRIMVLPRP